MSDLFTERADWQGAAWALAVWAAHFSLLWGASSVLPGSAAARWIALAGTLAAFAALALVWRVRSRHGKGRLVPVASGIAALAILFGALPALVG